MVTVHRHIVEVLHADGTTERCRLHGRFRVDSCRGEGVLVGDRALLGSRPPLPAPGMPPGPRTVLGIAPRITLLRRHLTSRTDGRVQGDLAVAANVELCLLVQSYGAPAFRPATADRLIALARASGIPGVLVLNKVEEAPPEGVEGLLAPYRRLGIEGFAVSALRGTGLEALANRVAGRLTVLLGPSGVGKSALTSALTVGEGPASAPLSEARLRADRGRHTTTGSRLYPLRGGGYIIDTAGIRSLSLPEGASADAAFPEVAAAALGCRFTDCGHRAEPGCAVRAAVAGGQLPRPAYEGWLRVTGDLQSRPAGRGYTRPGGRPRKGPGLRGRPAPDDPADGS